MSSAVGSSGSSLRAGLGAFALYAVFFAAVFLRSLLTGNYIAPSDSLDFGLATFLSKPAIWTAGMYSGYPIASDPQALTWYPVFQLARALGVGWNTFILLPYVVASTTMFLLVRRLTASWLAGFFAGFVFGYSGIMLAHISHFNQIHAASWIPLVVHGLLLTREGHLRAGTLVGSLAFALMITAGHPQVVVYTVYVVGALVLGWTWADGATTAILRARVLGAACVLGLGLGLAAISLLPMLELSELSRRATSSWEVYSSKPLPPWQLLTLVFPQSFGGFWTPTAGHVPYFGDSSPGEMTGYVGILPLSLALVGPFLVSSRRRDVIVWSLVSLVALLLCLGEWTPLSAVFYYAPGYASFRVPARHFFIGAFTVAAASGLVFAELIETRRRRAIATAVASTACVGALAGVVFALQTPSVRALLADAIYVRWAVQLPFIVSAMLLLAVALSTRGRSYAVLAILLMMIHVVEMTVFHYMMPGYRLSDYARVQESDVVPVPLLAALGEEVRRTGQRILAADGSRNPLLRPNLPRSWDIPAASGTGSLGIETYVDSLDMGGPGDVEPETLSLAHLGPDLFAVGYALVPESWPMAKELETQRERWTLVDRLRYRESDPESHYAVFRNARARSRAWCASETIVTEDSAAREAIRSGRIGDRVFDPGVVALVDERGPRLPGSPASPPGEVTEIDVRQQPQRYRVRAPGSCLLVLSEVYYPWWRASVDGVTVQPVRANLSMVGIALPPGEHVVTLWLRPVSLWQGAAITLMALTAWMALAVTMSRHRGRADRAPHNP